MSNALILTAMQKRLAAMSGGIATSGLNISYTPAAGTPYQEISLLPAKPDNSSAGTGHHIKSGTFQVLLRYPQGAGAGPAMRQADLIEQHFRRGTLLTEGGLSVVVTETPAQGPGLNVGDRYCLPVSIRYQADVFT